jgi:hypothetical protein
MTVVVCTSATGQAMPLQLWHTPVQQDKLYYDSHGVHQCKSTGYAIATMAYTSATG